MSTFGMGLIRLSFQARRKYNFEIQLLMIVVSGPAKCPATSLTNLAGSCSGPVAQLFKGSQDFSLCNTFQIENPLHLIGPLASGRTNRKATTSILTTGYPGITRSPNSYSSGNGIEKLLYLSLSNIQLKVVTPQTAAEEIREQSKPSGPAEATVMSDNDLLLDLGPNDEDVDYAAPRTPSHCPPTDTEERMTEDEQNDAYEN